MINEKIIYTEPEMEICFLMDSAIFTINSSLNSNDPYETEDDILDTTI